MRVGQQVWECYYKKITERNIGFITAEQQDKLKNTHAVVLGVGGLGGVIAEILVRTGIEIITIVDKDKFDITNLNRQNACSALAIGQLKVEVVGRHLIEINAGILLRKFHEVTEANIEEIIKGADIIINAIDEIKTIILIMRQARRLGIPVVEGWALPFVNVRVFTPDALSWEDTFHVNLQGCPLDEIPPAEWKAISMKVVLEFARIKGIAQFYQADVIDKMLRGEISFRTFAPNVWFTAVMMANETIKYLLKIGHIPIAPEMAIYDPYAHEKILTY